MPITVENAPAIASALLSLRGETQASLSKKSGIRVANLSVWLRGKKDQVISEKRVIGLLECLGVEGGRLKKYAVHNWMIKGTLEPLKFVLEALIPEEDLFRTLILNERGVDKTPDSVIFVPTGREYAMVKINNENVLAGRPEITPQTLTFGELFTMPYQIPEWPDNKMELNENREALKNQLDEYQELLMKRIRRDEDTRDLNSDELAELVVTEQPGSTQRYGGWNPGFDELSYVLKGAIKNGASPKEIAALIAEKYPV